MLQGFHLGQCFWEAVSNQVVIDVMCISRAIGERESRPSETSAPVWWQRQLCWESEPTS